MPNAITRETFLAPRAVKVQSVVVPELPGEGDDSAVVFVKEMNGAEYSHYAHLLPVDDPADRVISAMSALVVVTACDEKGIRLFTDEDREQVKAQPFGLVKRLYEAAYELNRLGPDHVREAKKNS